MKVDEGGSTLMEIEGKRRLMGIDDRGWRLREVHEVDEGESRWKEDEMNELEWRWIKINEGDWRLMEAKSESCMKKMRVEEGKWKRKEES